MIGVSSPPLFCTNPREYSEKLTLSHTLISKPLEVLLLAHAFANAFIMKPALQWAFDRKELPGLPDY